MLAAFALGAEAVQIGTRFAATEESSGHVAFKERIVSAGDGDTVLTLKKLAPVRLLRTPFALRALEAEAAGADREQQRELLGSKRERIGMFEGDIEEGEFEAGQSSAMVQDVLPAADVLRRIIAQYEEAWRGMCA
jgi:enoyl-[acyl-carrier protein] reductase II